jgi:CNT family concentrative nucleoside transporter
MTRRELFSVMVAGMSTIAGSVMLLYAAIIGSTIPIVIKYNPFKAIS